MNTGTAFFVGFVFGVCFTTVLVWQALKDKTVTD